MWKLLFEKVTEDIKMIDSSFFDCGVDSINGYIRESYYPTVFQEAYTYSISTESSAEKLLLGYYQILFREIELDDFPEEVADYCTPIKDGKISSLHIRFIAIDKKYQGKKIGTKSLEAIIKIIKVLAKDFPIRVITIDAELHLVEWYEELGFFKMIRNSEGQEGYTEAMYYNCILTDVEQLVIC
jgi:hypothetical protein